MATSTHAAKEVEGLANFVARTHVQTELTSQGAIPVLVRILV